jgi:oligopeptide/dipeptide ABC transporter ATP-binding protein
MRAVGRTLRTPLGLTAAILLALVLLTAIFAPILWGAQAEVIDTDDILAPPSAEHPIGTDGLGRDLLLRTLVATRLSVVLALVATLVAVTAGLILGGAPFLLGRPGRSITWFVGIVGESGSGKSLTALAIAQLVEAPGVVDGEMLRFLGADLLEGDPADHRRLLGTSLAMVFQDPMTSFNPTKRMGGQLAEVATQHHGMTRKQAKQRAVDRLGAVRIPDPERRARQYPHEFSGGMRQRAMIGMGLMGSPALVIADEPTTALDVTVQQQVLALLEEIRREKQAAILLISHDVSVVAEICDRVLVMYAGRIVEDLPADRLGSARHPYTRALLAAVPDMQTDLDQPLATVPGRPVDPADVPEGCAYAARCPLADARCRTTDPDLVADEADGSGRRVACWHAGAPLPTPRLRGDRETPATVHDPEDVTAEVVA